MRNCIGFGLGDQIELIKNKKLFKAAYTIDENEWNGNVSLQLKLKDINVTKIGDDLMVEATPCSVE